jgi:cell division protein FtsL
VTPRAKGALKRSRRAGVPAMVLGFLFVLGAAALVIWRQTKSVEMERRVRAVQEEQAIAEAERLALIKQIQTLSSRARITRVARERLGMHLPADSEIVFLPVPAGSATDGAEPPRSER